MTGNRATPANRLAALGVGVLTLLTVAGAPARAESYLLPPTGTDLIGTTDVAYARHEDTLMDIARAYSLGLDEILLANPAVDRWLPGEGSRVTLPTRFILPDAPREGIVLNLAERRLYYYPPTAAGAKPQVFTYPVGIGRMDWETPLGRTKIVRKVAGPDWRPPVSIKQEHLELYGEVLPDVVPAGPDNPLGPYALRLGLPGYLIHGSNKRDGVGSRVSHGCVRMYNEDITALFRRVPVGTPVTIVNQPVKIGWFAGALFLEVHVPLAEDEAFAALTPPTVDDVMQLIQQRAGWRIALDVDASAIATALQQASGIPVAVQH